jgi:hypothetical protein
MLQEKTMNDAATMGKTAADRSLPYSGKPGESEAIIDRLSRVGMADVNISGGADRFQDLLSSVRDGGCAVRASRAGDTVLLKTYRGSLP